MDKTIYYIKFFNKAIMIVLSVLLALFIYKIFFTQKYSLESKIYLDRNVTLTYYYPGDETGSGTTTGHNNSIGEFSIDEHGWYVYEEDGIEYLVLAAATTQCLDAKSSDCGKYNEKLSNITYYSYEDKIVLQIGNTKYNGIILDSCGRCMTENKMDIFVKDSNSKNPASLGAAMVIGEAPADGYNPNIVEQFDYPPTSYSGNLREGYLYEKLYSDKDTSKKTDETIAIDTDKALSDIFQRAETAYNDYEYSNVKVTDIVDTSNGNYLNWKQYDPSWKNIRLGNTSATIGGYGCASTALAIQLARSGVQTNIESTLNPGTFVQAMNKYGGYTSEAKILWETVTKFAPKFVLDSSDVKVSLSKNQLQGKVYKKLEEGYYIVMCSKIDCRHWVAVTGVTQDNILIADPGSTATTMFPKYNEIIQNKITFRYFKKLD